MLNNTGSLENSTSNSTFSDYKNDEIGQYNWPVLLLFSIVMAAVGGNILVCMAVRMEKKLQNMFNYFLVSLAFSDMLSAILVMPLSIIKAFLEDLPVPSKMCIAWYSLDVFFTSSTIIHLCMISVDRYMCLKYPLKYGHAKKRKHTVLKIVIVWILSFCIAGPLFLFSMFDTQKEVNYKGCGPETATFVISATVTSFYLPLGIMFIMYILTVQALHSQRKDQRKLTMQHCKKTPLHYTNSTNTTISINQDSVSYSQRYPSPSASFQPLATSDAVDSSRGMSSDKMDSDNPDLSSGKSPLLGHHENGHRRIEAMPSLQESTDDTFCGDRLTVEYPLTTLTPSSTHSNLCDPLTESSNQRQNSRKRLRMTVRIQRSNSMRSSRKNGQDKGRRAVQVLGVLFVVFVVCYLPFFLTYVIRATCIKCRRYISAQMLTIFEWVAYSGSMLNPFIYHIFNPQFRKSFHKLLRCKYD